MTSAAPIATAIVDAILKDLLDRRGLRQAWEEIDDEIQQEIREAWRKIIKNDARICGAVSWLRRNASAEKEPKARAAFVEAHNAILKIKEGRD